ncbi:MAG: BPSS1780 family membrane protein [Burkholderia sp.]|nr:BPSS1780 family membrane protein [Burkholderia sp.]
MKLTEVSAKSGYIWFWQGILFFFQNSLIFITLILIYLYSMMIVSIVPVIGGALSLFLIPGIRVHFMSVCRSVISDKPLIWKILFDSFRSYSRIFTRHLFILSVIYTAVMELNLTLSNIISNSMIRVEVLPYGMVEGEIYDAINKQSLLIMTLLCIPTSMMFWFSPILTAWHNLHPVKALFFSIISFWRNIFAFLVYGLLWLGTIIFLFISLLLMLHMIRASINMISVMTMLFIIVISAMLHCSFYVTYQGCFRQEEIERMSDNNT